MFCHHHKKIPRICLCIISAFSNLLGQFQYFCRRNFNKFCEALNFFLSHRIIDAVGMICGCYALITDIEVQIGEIFFLKNSNTFKFKRTKQIYCKVSAYECRYFNISMKKKKNVCIKKGESSILNANSTNPFSICVG